MKIVRNIIQDDIGFIVLFIIYKKLPYNINNLKTL